ncbi:hypothetical protein FJT64_027778 [Amphibalanus amphitrite]|uniref:MULE transposase domain-containing protein n=1 Tax=Amphibalanus amphitrite TaxID=1232801 RepID=A0A6A4VTP7_AMPAM|nr:hypothetical protein FJT64_027778 [Amphibalanus amphitrite]
MNLTRLDEKNEKNTMPPKAQCRAYLRQQAGQVPAEPASLADLIIPDEMTKTKDAPGQPEERFLLYDSANDETYDGGRIVIFSSDWGLEKLALSLHWAADGTFKVSPTLFQQLYTVHATTLGVTVPCVYGLLEDKTELTYRQTFNQIRAAILLRHPDAEGIYGTVITDLERAAMNSFQEVFPEKQCSTCFFHLSQAVWRKLQSLGLQRHYAEDADFAVQVRCLPAIAFLPTADIRAAFQEVVGVLPDECVDLITYFENTFIGRELGGRWRPPLYAPDEWTQYARTLDGLGRTTNAVEGWHRRFAGKAGSHPSTFSLVTQIQAEEAHWRVEIGKVVAGATPRHRSAIWERVSERVTALTRRWRDGDVGTAHFLRGIAHNFTF